MAFSGFNDFLHTDSGNPAAMRKIPEVPLATAADEPDTDEQENIANAAHAELIGDLRMRQWAVDTTATPNITITAGTAGDKLTQEAEAVIVAIRILESMAGKIGLDTDRLALLNTTYSGYLDKFEQWAKLNMLSDMGVTTGRVTATPSSTYTATTTKVQTPEVRRHQQQADTRPDDIEERL